MGAGLETILAGNWSVFVQYNYIGFGRRALVLTETIPAAAVLGPPTFTEIIREDIHVIKAGINYHFNWGGPVAASR